MAKADEAARLFAEKWAGKGYEKGESQKFWMELLSSVLGVENPADWLVFEQQVMLDHTSFIDVLIPKTHVMIEQKSLGKSLTEPIRQSDGTRLKPIEQAKRYAAALPYSARPRWIVSCNFAEFLVYDMETPNAEPQQILLKDLEKEAYRLRFLVDTGDVHLEREMEVSIQAGRLVGRLYDALAAQYGDMEDPHIQRSLNVLCVRLVFLLYAEDAGLFGRHSMFHDYMKDVPVPFFRQTLLQLFQVLDTPTAERDKYLNDALSQFPYVNGGLFAETDVEVPQFTEDIRHILLDEASAGFDWSDISPTIFGAVFESTLNPATRRAGGMHYTSIENIHKLIDPLFLDDLREEFASIQEIKSAPARQKALAAFHEKLAEGRYFDPAAGSGNFLTETYLSLRRLENEVIKERTGGDTGQIMLGAVESPIKVSIGQFYGIEINDFAVTVARTALWIAESQTLAETESIVHLNLDFFPLKTYDHLHEGNALRLDWKEILPPADNVRIMGNPPFVGYSYQTAEQKADIQNIWQDEKGKTIKSAGKVDYVSCWHFKASQYMEGTSIRAAFVSTNSITQGEQVALIWKYLYERFHIHIDFAWRTFKWNSESTDMAAVHCVIVGFSTAPNDKEKRLYESGRYTPADTINPYLVAAPAVFIENRKKPLCDVPPMAKGSQPTDDGNLIIEAADYEEFLAREPKARPYVRPFMGAREFINGLPRYCLWLVDCPAKELRAMPLVKARIEACREFRLKSTKEATRRSADTPAIFQENRQPPDGTHYIAVPMVSSENRRYIPMGYVSSETVASNLLFTLPNATLPLFALLVSNVHMAWMRAVAGRLKSDYRYSNTIVYNNFPFPTLDEKQKAQLTKTAQAILDARAKEQGASLADLYDDTVMPKELREAHRANDRAVLDAYHLPRTITESSCVAHLMRLYEALTQK